MRTRRRFHIVLGMVFALVAVAVLAAMVHIGRESAGFPGEHWDHIAPERAGYDPDLLAEFVAEVGGHGVVVRNGHFVYAALKDGLIRDLDERISLHVPDLDFIGERGAVGDGEITWRHLLQRRLVME